MTGPLWYACGEDTIPAGEDWLAALERERLAQIRFTKRRTEFLLRRTVGKRAVAAVLSLGDDPATCGRIGMLNHPSGAPYVVLDGAVLDLEVSLTDRAGHAVALIRPSGSQARGPVGIDLELVEERTNGFVEDFLTAGEAAWVRARGQVAVDANLLWSAKEAALKVLKVGLRADTRTVEVRVDDTVRADGWAALEVVQGESGATFPGWWRRDGHFVLTVVTTHPDGPPQALPGTGNLAAAEPIHSWLAEPVVRPAGPN